VIGAITAVVVIVAALVIVGISSSSSGGALRQPAPQAAVQTITNVPDAVLTSAAAKISNLYPAVPGISGALNSGGKPELLYIGAEFCPFCAAERWPMIIALSKFGTFTNLQQTHSAVTDGNVGTWSFYGSTYTSPYLTFTSVENETNTSKPLQKPTAAQQAIWTSTETKYEGKGGYYPFIDIGGKYVMLSAQYDDAIVYNHSFSTILSTVGTNNNTIGASIDAAAAVMTKYICDVTSNKPASVCSTFSRINAPVADTSASGSSSATSAG
jgi:thiol-disulfide isomerase/thioredoxin